MVAILLLSPCQGSVASDITVQRAYAEIRNDIIVVDADFELEFNTDAIDALNSGIPLVFELAIRIGKPRRYLWDKELFATQRRYSVERHSLSNQFILTDLITGERRLHGSLELAIEDLGRIRQLPVTDVAGIDTSTPNDIALRFSLDINALPAPMIPLAYVSPGWHMSSGWYRWPANL